MELWDKIAGLAESRGLHYLVIGGHAVAAHGYERTTRDADLLVCRDEAGHWRETLLAAGYSVHFQGPNFIQFNPPANNPWPVDLMLVSQSVFDGMMAEAQPKTSGQGQIRVVSLKHLLALKLFALKNQPSHRVLKDMDDLVNLIQTNQIDVRQAWFRDLALKQANQEFYEKLVHALG